jgi:hypothetical protein
MHYFYFVSLPRHYVFRAHFSPSSGDQVYNVAMVLGLLLKRLSAGPRTVALKVNPSTIATLYTWSPDDGLKLSPKHVEAW